MTLLISNSKDTDKDKSNEDIDKSSSIEFCPEELCVNFKPARRFGRLSLKHKRKRSEKSYRKPKVEMF
jgi:hypothetical protein